MDPLQESQLLYSRRQLLSCAGIGLAALATLLSDDLHAGPEEKRQATDSLPGRPHFPPKAKRIIYLFQSGAPSQIDLFDYKPKLNDRRGQELPDSVRKGQRLTGMTA